MSILTSGGISHCDIGVGVGVGVSGARAWDVIYHSLRYKYTTKWHKWQFLTTEFNVHTGRRGDKPCYPFKIPTGNQ